jgi:GntR family transcriptional regulator/MocR family aminotransferase
MRAWTLPIALDARSATPLFLQIARAVADDAARGRLRPGDVLPGSRTLATELGVHRSTVVAAYEELKAQGWAIGDRGATAIAATSPDVEPRRTPAPRGGIAQRPGFRCDPLAIAHAPANLALTGNALQLWGGVPDTRLIDLDLLGRALRRAARQHGRSLLRYATDPRGHASLREALARMLAATRGLPVCGDDVLVTHGSQMALDLVARALVQPGDVIAVEALGYRAAWAAFERAGAHLEPVAVDAEGIRTSELAALARRRRVRAIYVTPHHQYPTTVVMSPRRRLALLELARTHGIAVIEDDYDHEYHFDGRPVLPLASADRTGNVIYIGGLAKVLAPGLRIGFVVAPRTVLERLAAERAILDRHGNQIVEAALAELLDEGEIQRHVRRTRRIYRERRDALAAALDRTLRGTLVFDIPAGGLTLWARADGVDVEAWRVRAEAAGVLVQSGAAFTFDGSRIPYFRIGYGVCDTRELALAAARLARAAFK